MEGITVMSVLAQVHTTAIKHGVRGVGVVGLAVAVLEETQAVEVLKATDLQAGASRDASTQTEP